MHPTEGRGLVGNPSLTTWDTELDFGVVSPSFDDESDSVVATEGGNSAEGRGVLVIEGGIVIDPKIEVLSLGLVDTTKSFI